MASEKILNQKKEEVSALAAKMKEAKLVLLTDYRGINVEDVTNLRTELRNAKAEYKVIKNNIIKGKYYGTRKHESIWNNGRKRNS